MTHDDALEAIREAIADVTQAVDLRSLEQLERYADDLIIDSWSAELVADEDLPDLKLELAVAKHSRLKQLNPQPISDKG
ncbi:hypothetical protein ABOC32_29035 (plasmid) [Pseudomonas sp. WOUb67]|uniref:hypothetical protein n=1 Tax=Pseudomonas sp. WOUb67 TaxID=3161136 RepID=UPI003CF94AA2